MFLINCPVPSVVALTAPASARTTLRALPYFKNAAAVRKYLNVLESDVPKFAASSFSEPTVTISSTGPQLNDPANPPILVETAGTTLVASISFTSTPGDT